MKKRNWTGKEKLSIVLEGLREDTTIAEVCNRHQISQNQYYRWRDRLLSQGEKLFAQGGPDKEAARLQAEVRKLKGIIGDLTVELKKNDF